MMNLSRTRWARIAPLLATLPVLLALAGRGVTTSTSATLEKARVSTLPAAGITHLAMSLDGLGLKVQTAPAAKNITIRKVVSPNIRVTSSVSGHTLTFNIYDPSYTLENSPTYIHVILPPGRSLSIQTEGGAAMLEGSYHSITIASQGGAVSASSLSAQSCTITDSGGAVTLTTARAPQNLAIQTQGGAITLHGPLALHTIIKDQGGAITLGTVPQQKTLAEISDSGGPIVSRWPGVVVQSQGNASGTVPGRAPESTLRIHNNGGPVTLS
jgi:hypothetical protein